ncbi:hypothetical protein BKA03_003093 [Demequina lutea]|uniref:Uncharacterized protein n=1 Tax=Demequina lutea TaxID=431489 RepID=A0A7Y9ZCK9_9MICO|nr:hypothetical protein [Demequina lutea]
MSACPAASVAAGRIAELVSVGVGESCAQHARSRCANTRKRWCGSRCPWAVVRQTPSKVSGCPRSRASGGKPGQLRGEAERVPASMASARAQRSGGQSGRPRRPGHRGGADLRAVAPRATPLHERHTRPHRGAGPRPSRLGVWGRVVGYCSVQPGRIPVSRAWRTRSRAARVARPGTAPAFPW